MVEDTKANRTCREKVAALNLGLFPSCDVNGSYSYLLPNCSTACVLGTTFQTAAPTATSDRICKPDTVCVLGTTFETAAPTLTTDRICNHDNDCTLGSTFQSVAPTLTADRACGNYDTNCVLGVTFQSVAPTLTTDRACSATTNCSLGITFQSVVPTLTSNRICKSISPPCASGVSYASRPTFTSDRGICTACTPSCPSGETESFPCTPYTNLQCAGVSNNTTNTGLSPAQIVGIVVGVVAAAVLAVGVDRRLNPRAGVAPAVQHLQLQDGAQQRPLLGQGQEQQPDGRTLVYEDG